MNYMVINTIVDVFSKPRVCSPNDFWCHYYIIYKRVDKKSSINLDQHRQLKFPLVANRRITSWTLPRLRYPYLIAMTIRNKKCHNIVFRHPRATTVSDKSFILTYISHYFIPFWDANWLIYGSKSEKEFLLIHDSLNYIVRVA